MNHRHFQGAALAAFLSLVLFACGGGGGGDSDSSSSGTTASTGSSSSSSTASSVSSSSSSSSASLASNAVAVTVSSAMGGVNQPLVSVKVCEPGTTTCVTVDNVLLDTGSSGLRLFASALGSTFTDALTAQTETSSGNALAECAQFGSGDTWGSIKQVDLYLGGETASSLPIQVIGDTATTYATTPSNCTNLYTSASQLGANGILGVNQSTVDCGSSCTSASSGFYYSCTSSGTCTAVGLATASQIPQPVRYFTSSGNDNGVVLVMPSVSSSGAASVSGVLYFGIGTQSNNTFTGVTAYDTDSHGDFTKIVATVGSTSRTITDAFTDSGSNGLFFPSSITQCSGGSGWYCPTSDTAVSAVVYDTSGNTTTLSLTISNALTLFSNNNSSYYAFNNLGAYTSGSFDLGLPFFFGRSVYVAIDGASTTGGTGPYVAF